MTHFHHFNYPRYGGIVAPPGAHTLPFKSTGLLKRHSVQCHATGKNHHRCKRRAVIGPYCWQHAQSIDHLRIKTSAVPNAGNGMYVTQTIPAGTNIASYTGELDDEPAFDHRHEAGDPYVIDVGNEKVLVPTRSSDSFGYYANDPKPYRGRTNAKLSVYYVPYTPINSADHYRVNIKTTKRIKAGNEVYTPYGHGYNWHWPHIPPEPLHHRRAHV